MKKDVWLGEYRARWYPAVGKNAAGWRVFSGGEFKFSAENLFDVRRMLRGKI